MKPTPLTMLGLLASTLAGCTALPVDGPHHIHIDRQASEAILKNPRDVVLNYVLVDLSRSVLDEAFTVGPESFFKTFGTGRGTSPELRLGIGDIVSVSIFELSGGGLFSLGELGGRPGAPATLPAQAIDGQGFISVPYAGRVRASGQTLRQVQKDIETQLSKRAIEPQVIISLVEQNATDVSIFGDATGNFKAKIKPGGERVLDVIAKAGIKNPGFEVFITLQRGASRATVFLPNLINRPEENIFVRPGDVIYAFRQQQTYIAVGALTNVSQTQGLTGKFAFDAERLSLAEGIAKAGGLLDGRSDPRQVFLYRLEYRSTLEKYGMNLDRFSDKEKLIPTIYRANYRDPSVFFAADRFPMRHRDIIYVANAESVEISKFLGFVSTVTGTVAGVSGDIVATRDAFRALRN